jgi:hypothetical protein
MSIEPKIITTQNGTIVTVDRNRFLDEEFCDQAIEYYCQKHNCNDRIMNTYLSNKAIEEYIRDKNIEPVYEN